MSRLPRRSAIVAFSAEEVYGIAELIRRQSGGAAVVLGALSPRTRNAQVELYPERRRGLPDRHRRHRHGSQSRRGPCGLRVRQEVRRVPVPQAEQRRSWPRSPAGPGGYMRDGTFGSTARCPPFDAETVEALENHVFDPVRILQWRNPDLEFSSLARLRRFAWRPAAGARSRARADGRGRGGPRGPGAGRRHPGHGPLAMLPSSASGRSAKCRIIGRFPRRPMRIWSASSIVS